MSEPLEEVDEAKACEVINKTVAAELPRRYARLPRGGATRLLVANRAGKRPAAAAEAEPAEGVLEMAAGAVLRQRRAGLDCELLRVQACLLPQLLQERLDTVRPTGSRDGARRSTAPVRQLEGGWKSTVRHRSVAHR